MKTLCSIILLCAVAAIAPAQSTITYTITGTLVPQSGTDCLGLDNMMLSLTATVSAKLKPKMHSMNSATYVLPVHSVSVTIGATTFLNGKPWTVMYTLTSTSDNLTFVGPVSPPGPSGTTYTINANLAANSFPPTVLGATGHPAGFMPTPQTLTPPLSFLKYTTTLCTASNLTSSSTTTGINGTANSKSAAPTH